MYSCSVAAVTTVMFCCTSHLDEITKSEKQTHKARGHVIVRVVIGGGSAQIHNGWARVVLEERDAAFYQARAPRKQE